MPEVNLIAIAAATLVCFMSGFLWFGPKTFYPTWWRLMGKSASDVPGGGLNMGVAFGSVLVGQVLQVTVLALILSALQIVAPIDGALVGLLIGVGIVGGSSASHRIFAGHGFGVLLIEAGNDVVNLGLAGAILVALS
jgi:hypothetical protein